MFGLDDMDDFQGQGQSEHMSQGFDLDEDDLNTKPKSKEPTLAEQMQNMGMGSAGGPDGPSLDGFDGSGIDPTLMAEMQEMMTSGKRDPAKIKRMMANPAFAAMMEQYGGDVSSMVPPQSQGMRGGGSSKAEAQRK